MELKVLSSGERWVRETKRGLLIDNATISLIIDLPSLALGEPLVRTLGRRIALNMTLALLAFLLSLNPHRLVTLLQHLGPHLAIRREAGQDLRRSTGHVGRTVSLIVDRPELDSLAVGVAQVLEGENFGGSDDHLGDHGLCDLDQHARFAFVFVRVPILLLVLVQCYRMVMGGVM